MPQLRIRLGEPPQNSFCSFINHRSMPGSGVCRGKAVLVPRLAGRTSARKHPQARRYIIQRHYCCQPHRMSDPPAPLPAEHKHNRGRCPTRPREGHGHSGTPCLAAGVLALACSMSLPHGVLCRGRAAARELSLFGPGTAVRVVCAGRNAACGDSHRGGDGAHLNPTAMSTKPQQHCRSGWTPSIGQNREPLPG